MTRSEQEKDIYSNPELFVREQDTTVLVPIPIGANPDYCLYGICKATEPHMPWCMEYSPSELIQAK